MIRCKLEYAYTREVVGTYQFDVLPRVGEAVRLPSGKRVTVADVEHVLAERGTSTVEATLGVWKND